MLLRVVFCVSDQIERIFFFIIIFFFFFVFFVFFLVWMRNQFRFAFGESPDSCNRERR